MDHFTSIRTATMIPYMIFSYLIIHSIFPSAIIHIIYITILLG